jgi:hypothetical protein
VILICSTHQFLSQALIILRITMGNAYSRPTPTPSRIPNSRVDRLSFAERSTIIESDVADKPDETFHSDHIIIETERLGRAIRSPGDVDRV